MDPAQALLVILSAGASRRMGTCKALLERNGRSLLALHLDAARAAGFGRVRVVTGAHTCEIAQALAEYPHNPHWIEQLHRPDWSDGGLIDSVRLALVGEAPDQVVVATPIDCVPATPAILRALVHRLARPVGDEPDPQRSPEPKALCAGFQGKPGHPVAFLVEVILALGPEDTLRTALCASPLVECPDASVLLNLNTPEDWTQWAGSPWGPAAPPPQPAS